MSKKNGIIEELISLAQVLPEPIQSKFMVHINDFSQDRISSEAFDSAVYELSSTHFVGELHLFFLSEVERIKPRKPQGLMFSRWNY
ncbi:hypothetical protein FHS19_001725 [Paenibacillus rhizosphaerae]|uniref:Uncharacterized protein n=1 Tax=Paenibacillus rhizosphaerae TaxID=297318 RepID=A0A839TK84_9BACL|nr:hypothetical protein [Paenibacillus rhizosphaerae]MBB3127071.1 hypothetical protein [Paenibacillus rhizosphaerae]